MSRASVRRVEEECRRLGMELKTTIPQTIQKARELGDLRENAEYDAAKAKQASYAKRFAELEAQLGRVRLLEDLEREEGVALPGTRIRLEPLGDATDAGEMSVWMLGEGDQDLGEGVVSYKAPLGLALHGKRVGDEVEITQEAGPRRFRVSEIREELPQA